MTTETEAATPQGQETAEPAAAASAETKTADGQEQAGAQTEGEEPKQPEGDAKAQTPRGVQKRLDELRRQAGDAQRFNERLLNLLERTVAGGSVPTTEAPSGPPKREDYDTHEAYLEARADWKVAEAVKVIHAKAEQTAAQRQAAEREAAWRSRLDSVASKYEDFEEVALSPDLRISDAMAEAMKESDIGPEIAYHLGKNPAEARRIAALSPLAQAREIGKIEAHLTSKPAATRPASKAPAPIDPVGGKGGAAGSLEAMSQREYEARRAKDGAWWAGRR